MSSGARLVILAGLRKAIGLRRRDAIRALQAPSGQGRGLAARISRTTSRRVWVGRG